MKLEDQVCTKEQGQKLKTLGIKQHSLVCYIGNELEFFLKSFYDWAEQKDLDATAAFTVAELGVLLDHIPVKTYQELHTNRKGFYIETKLGEKEYFEHEAHARARMLIFRLEKGWDTAETINTRFT